MKTTLPVAVVGAGPVGLAAAAHLLERGLEPLVLEAGDEVASNVARWHHVRLFSPWRYNLDAASVRLLEPTGWQAPSGSEHPTGAELRERYLLPLAGTPGLGPRLRLGARVTAVARLRRDKLKDAGRDDAPFELTVERDGRRERVLSRAVVDASGTVRTPNPLGASGVPAAGEDGLAGHVAYGLPNVLDGVRDRYANRRVLVVGSGHSALNVLQDLVELRRVAPATEITWAIRGAAEPKLFGGGDGDGLPERAALGSLVRDLVTAAAIRLVPGVEIDELRRAGARVIVRHAHGELGAFDQIVAATGFRPDLSLLREVRLGLDASLEAPVALAPLIDPNVHWCGSVPPHGALELAHPERDLYIAGMKSYGRAPTFLLLTGYEQVRSIAAAIAGDLEAATRVELTLPETGVCCASADPAGATSCCG